MERSEPVHWTLFIWIGPVPKERGEDVVDLKIILKNKAGKYRNQRNMGLRAVFHVCGLRQPIEDSMTLADFVMKLSL